MKFYVLLIAAIIAVLALSAAGRAFIVWAAKGLKPLMGIFIFLLSAHYTILRHLLTSRAVIYPSLSKKTVHRPE